VPEVTGILETTLYVDDMSRAIEFYQRVFALDAIGGDHRRMALAVGRQVLLLRARGSSDRHDATGSAHIAFSIEPTALRAWEAWLAEQQIPIEERRTWPRGGESIYFRDPDRHLIEIVTPGVWTVY
jgi:catechol 2,3-dioxygenase-like lactoylglutathione lyase family enzyme